jgi:serine/threonine protein kinase
MNPSSQTVANGRFVVEAHLGDGGQAAVFRVREVRTGAARALKVLLPKYAAKDKVRARFADEARTMAQLDHPNLVRVFDVEPLGAWPYLVMELVPSGSLADWLEAYRRFPPRQAIDVTLQICAGAAAAHARDVVHRDIKPLNVLVATDGRCKLTDFGIARTDVSHRTRVGAALGTEGYMAPEQARDARKVDARADVFSIGMTLFVLLAGVDPAEWLVGGGRNHVPEPLLPVLEKATALRVDRRYQSADELARALRAVRDLLPPDPGALPLDRGHPRARGPKRQDGDWPELLPLLDPGARPESQTGGLDPEPRADAPTLGRSAHETVILPDPEPRRRWPVAFAVTAAALASLGLLIGGLWGGSATAADPGVAGELDQALIAEAAVVDDLASLGADRSPLDDLYAEWRASEGERRADAAVRLVDEVERVSESLSDPGSTAWEDAHRRVRRLRVARDGYRAQQ